jgi:hypothetical protein
MPMSSQIYRGAALALAITAAAATSALAGEYRVTGDIEEVFGASYDKSTTLGAGVGGESRNSCRTVLKS